MPDMGMGSPRAESLKQRLTQLGAKPDDVIGENAVRARFELDAVNEEDARRHGIELFDRALEDAEITDADGAHPNVDAESVERIQG